MGKRNARNKKEIADYIASYHFTEEQKEKMAKGLCKAQARNQKEGEESMRKYQFKKVAAVAAVCLLAAGGTVYGAGKVTMLRSSIDLGTNAEYEGYQDLEKAEKKAGFEVDAPESFSNGFAVSDLHVSGTEGTDDSGNVMDKWETIYIEYTDGEGRRVNSAMEPARNLYGERKDVSDSRMIDGINVSYNYDEYLFVPAGYDIPEEELQRQETDTHFYISEGSSEVERKFFSSVSFVKEDISYHLYTYDGLSSEELFTMAEELIKK